MGVRLTDEQRREIILLAGVRLAQQNGILSVAHGTVAKRCVVQTSTSTVKRLYPTKADLWRAIADHSGDSKLKDEVRKHG